MSYSAPSPRGSSSGRARTRALSCSSFAPASACTRQGCTLPPDGAHAAAARISRTVVSGIGVGRKARHEYREATASRTSMGRLRGICAECDRRRVRCQAPALTSSPKSSPPSPGCARRLARWLLMMRDRSDEDALLITQSLLAEMSGVQRPTITIAARELERAGLIERGRRQVTILDRQGLTKASCECYQLVRKRIAFHLPQTS